MTTSLSEYLIYNRMTLSYGQVIQVGIVVYQLYKNDEQPISQNIGIGHTTIEQNEYDFQGMCFTLTTFGVNIKVYNLHY